MSEPRPWHVALAYGVLGRRLAELGHQTAPDVAELAGTILDVAGGPDALREEIRQVRAHGVPWPHPLPPDLSSELGAAQYAAAMRALLDLLDLATPSRLIRPDRAPTAEDAALGRDVPPHYGGG